MDLVCDAVFEGGGVRGIGLVGGVCGMEAAGYTFRYVVGTSAGSIMASLLAAGYSGAEIKAEMLKLDFTKLQGEDWLTNTGTFGKVLKLLLVNGIYNADYLEAWLEGLLKRKGKTRFGDIRVPGASDEKFKYRFQAIASDLSNSSMLVLPRDLSQFGIDPDQFSITKAVRMSISIPVFYEPYILTDIDGRKHVIVDGGMLSNYPMWLLDDRKPNLDYPTFGFKFCSAASEESETEDYADVRKLPGLLKSLVRTSMDAHDKYYISNSMGDFQRTIPISSKILRDGKPESVNAVDFAISAADQEAIFNNGLQAVKTFLRTWSFENWKSAFRTGAQKSGRATVTVRSH